MKTPSKTPPGGAFERLGVKGQADPLPVGRVNHAITMMEEPQGAKIGRVNPLEVARAPKSGR